ncbi:hypothetical protein EXIGLDRAFT_773034 [Exidia glandulosa HHB12029]|uniref:Uncharacterized protein n=1 Tax=Exidia glandulosa HHB12029 TaxID=1314781 RepID=A0A165EZP9_EXIGL|nr:hypothetical protein EXIGLDRAFT_773034 [Exidia glandulosa HHB12029]
MRNLRQARRDTTPKAQVAIIAVCVVLIVLIAAGVGGWFLWRLRNKPKRVKHLDTKAAIRIDDGERAHQALIDQQQPRMSTVRGVGGIEGWLQQTQRGGPGPQETPRTPRTVPLPVPQSDEALVPTSPPPAATAFRDNRASSPFERPVSAQSSVNHSRQSSEQAHGHQHSNSNSHARPLAFIKNIFHQPQEDGVSERATTPTVARLPMMPPPPRMPNRPPRPDSLVFSQGAYEIYPDASASQYGGPQGRRGSTSSDVVPPMPDLPRGVSRRQSYGALSSQGGLPLPSFYLPSEQGDGTGPALAIGESVLASPLDNRHQLDVPRRGGPRRPGSNFVVVNATAEDD